MQCIKIILLPILQPSPTKVCHVLMTTGKEKIIIILSYFLFWSFWVKGPDKLFPRSLTKGLDTMDLDITWQVGNEYSFPHE